MKEKQPAYPLDKAPARIYEIRIKGHLEPYWSDWLGGLAVDKQGQGHTLLTGPVPDQAALHGILIQIRDMGLALISVTSKDIPAEE